MRETKEEELLCTALQERDRGSNLDAFFSRFPSYKSPISQVSSIFLKDKQLIYS